MTLMPMASVMAVTEPKWVSVWGRFLWVMLLSMVLGSLLALLLPLGALEEQCLTVLKGFYLLRSKLDRMQHAITKCSSPSTELSVTSREAPLLAVKTKASPGKADRPAVLTTSELDSYLECLPCPVCRAQGTLVNKSAPSSQPRRADNWLRSSITSVVMGKLGSIAGGLPGGNA